MTKEQILNKHSDTRLPFLENRPQVVTVQNALDAMEEYAKQQVAKERERAGKMVSDLDKLAEQYKAEGLYLSWAAIKQITGSYKNNLPPETTGNQTAC